MKEVETRGRPRNTCYEDVAEQIADRHDTESLPFHFDVASIKGFRNSTALKELQEMYDNIFCVYSDGDQICVGYRK